MTAESTPGSSSRTGILALFPGQGSQTVGMGYQSARSSAAASEVFDIASDTLKLDARRLCWRTPVDELVRTENAQPAIIIATLANWAAAKETAGDTPIVFAGHSVGAIGAAAAAGYISIDRAILLAASRGALMASVPDVGAMLAVAISGCECADMQEARAKELADRYGLDVAAVNSPSQIVLSGERGLVAAAKEALAGKAKELYVSNAFHSRVMAPVEPHWIDMVNKTDMTPTSENAYIASIAGGRTHHSSDVREDLRASLTKPVLWSRTMETTVDLPEIQIFGPSRSLARLIRPYRNGRAVKQMEFEQ